MAKGRLPVAPRMFDGRKIEGLLLGRTSRSESGGFRRETRDRPEAASPAAAPEEDFTPVLLWMRSYRGIVSLVRNKHSPATYARRRLAHGPGVLQQNRRTAAAMRD